MEPVTLAFALASVGVSHRSNREEGGRGRQQKQVHKPVMVREIVHELAPAKGDIVVDATYGAGGHSKALKKAAKIKLISIDADPTAGADVNDNFANLEDILERLGIKKINKALFDLGWNRTQLSAGKGFSFLVNEPLNMSYGEEPLSGFTADEILNTWKEKTIADVLFGYGEERFARRIAKAIIERRELEPFHNTIELVEVIRDAVPAHYRHQRLHFATRTFQALRIAVNDELKAIEKGLSAAWKHLACGGRLAVVTFHSTEDRAVKRLFAALASKEGKLILKKPGIPSAAEVSRNPSARSAKLRVIEKVCTE